MCKINQRSSLQKKGLLMTFLVIFSLFIFENAFSRKHWDSNNVHVVYTPKDHSIEITFVFCEYCFGPVGEDAYFQLFNISFYSKPSTYELIIDGSVEQQAYKNSSWLTMRKFTDDKLQFIGTIVPKDRTFWSDSPIRVEVRNEIGGYSFLGIKWFLPSNLKVDAIVFNGIWELSGINCNDFVHEKFLISDKLLLKTELKPHSKLNNKIKKGVDLVVNNRVKINKEADAFVINGADLDENIRIYTPTGSLVKSVDPNSDIVKIPLTAKQIYFINIGQSRYKVAL